MIVVRRPTDELVHSLVADLRPMPRSALALRLVLGATAGAAISVVLLMLLVGSRPDLAAVVHSLRFWSKAGYMKPIGRPSRSSASQADAVGRKC